jgi:hypothetical protein
MTTEVLNDPRTPEHMTALADALSKAAETVPNGTIEYVNLRVPVGGKYALVRCALIADSVEAGEIAVARLCEPRWQEGDIGHSDQQVAERVSTTLSRLRESA